MNQYLIPLILLGVLIIFLGFGEWVLFTYHPLSVAIGINILGGVAPAFIIWDIFFRKDKDEQNRTSVSQENEN